MELAPVYDLSAVNQRHFRHFQFLVQRDNNIFRASGWHRTAGGVGLGIKIIDGCRTLSKTRSDCANGAISMGKSSDILLELEGHFWWYGETIPEGQYAPPSALPGVLTITDDGLGKLVVTGSLMRSGPIKLDNAGRRAAENNLDTLERRTIAGWVEKGFHRVYLRNVVDRRVERSADGRETEKFHAGFSLVGRSTLPQDKSDLTFSRLSIDLSGLEAWRWNDAVTVEPVNADEAGHSQTVRWRVNDPKYSLKEAKLRLRTDVRCDRFEGMPIREVSFRQYDWLDYIPESLATPEFLKQEFGHIEEFLALLTGTYYYFDWPQTSNGEGDKLESFTLYFQRFRENTEPLEVTQLWTTFPQIGVNPTLMLPAAK
jgi:ApeA N-terminal domain 1